MIEHWEAGNSSKMEAKGDKVGDSYLPRPEMRW